MDHNEFNVFSLMIDKDAPVSNFMSKVELFNCTVTTNGLVLVSCKFKSSYASDVSLTQSSSAAI